jgi:hypothetical protein
LEMGQKFSLHLICLALSLDLSQCSLHSFKLTVMLQVSPILRTSHLVGTSSQAWKDEGLGLGNGSWILRINVERHSWPLILLTDFSKMLFWYLIVMP